MQILVSNTITSSTEGVRVPLGMNPVRVGRDPRCAVRLNSHYVPPEAGAIANTGGGWQFWALAGGVCRLGGRVLDKNEHRPIEPGQHIGVWPFNLVVCLDDDDAVSPEGQQRLLAGRAAGVVGG